MMNRIIGPRSDHHIHCKLCGYRGNSYYHMHCPGGKCHLCGKPHTYKFCKQCGGIACDEHLEEYPYGGMMLCTKCMAAHRAEAFAPPKSAPQCDCYDCRYERDYEKRIKKMKKDIEARGTPKEADIGEIMARTVKMRKRKGK